MFAIHYRRDVGTKDDFVLIAKGLATLHQARNRRKMPGDLVVDDSGRVVNSEDWLFEWEKTQPECFARRAMRLG